MPAGVCHTWWATTAASITPRASTVIPMGGATAATDSAASPTATPTRRSTAGAVAVYVWCLTAMHSLAGAPASASPTTRDDVCASPCTRSTAAARPAPVAATDANTR